MSPTRCTPLVLLFFLTSSGCVSYRYDLTPAGPAASTQAGASDVASPDQPMTVVKDRDLVVPAAPARLRLRQVESRCVLLIENPTDAELTLDGGGSAVVDPLGQSRGIAGQLIPPGAFVKLVLPPLRDAPPAGPAFQFGLGVLVDSDGPRDDLPRVPRYLDVGRSQDYWEWDGEGKICIVLTFKQNGTATRHEFFLTRTKR